MKLIFLSLCIFALTYSSFSQYKFPINTVKVIYNSSFVTDSNYKYKIFSENTVLYSGNEYSLYRSLDNEVYDSAFEKQVTSSSSIENSMAVLKNLKRGSKQEVLKDFKNSKLIINEYLLKYYLVTENIFAFNWDISTDTMSIYNYHCQKATTNYKGRVYTAWFTNEIPVSDGPWKFYGLPGLILRIFDAKNEVSFEVVKIEKLYNGISFKSSGNNITPSTRKEFNTLKSAYMKDPAAFFQTNFESNATSSSAMKITFPPGYKIPLPNNAIELSE